jgi:hypothetical protein
MPQNSNCRDAALLLSGRGERRDEEGEGCDERKDAWRVHAARIGQRTPCGKCVRGLLCDRCNNTVVVDLESHTRTAPTRR